jgi:hypothetical protein
MSDLTPRRFTLLDAMAITAAVGLGFGLIRLESSLPDLTHTRFWWSWSDWLAAVSMPVTVCVAILNLRRRRGEFSRCLAGPGVSICFILTIFWITEIFIHSHTLWLSLFGGHFASSVFARIFIVQTFEPESPGPIVVAAWIVSALMNRPRWKADWLEWSGRALGLNWIFVGIVRPIYRSWT